MVFSCGQGSMLRGLQWLFLEWDNFMKAVVISNLKEGSPD
jgi:hypothetical protein